MEIQYFCKNPKRLLAIKKSGLLNAIEYIEVLDALSVDPEQRQRILFIHCVQDVTGITESNVVIQGGVRRAVKVLRVSSVPEDILTVPPSWNAVKKSKYFSSLLDNDNPQKVLIVEADSIGDFSTYTLKLVKSALDDSPPSGFDPVLSKIDFGFKIECPSGFDCQSVQKHEIPRYEQPRIDYLAKDYSSFRRLLLDRLSIIVPDWKERNGADTGIALVEALSYYGDYLSYYQDAVATEAYLGTARKRSSTRRHARLVDYHLHEGCNARVWLQFQSGSSDIFIPEKTQLMTHIAGFSPRIQPDSQEYKKALLKNPQIFETLHKAIISPAHHEIHFYTWGDEDCCLPKGATRATLKDDAADRLRLRKGDVIIFEEIRSSETGLTSEKNPAKRHAVRLTSVYPEAEMIESGGNWQLHLKEQGPGVFQSLNDPLSGQPIVEISWSKADALPYAFCLEEVHDPDQPSAGCQPVTVVRGNIVLAEHGRSLILAQNDDDKESLFKKIPQSGVRYRLALKQTGISHSVIYRDAVVRRLPAVRTLQQDPREAIARIILQDENMDDWFAAPDLLDSGEFDREFVAEIDPGVQAVLRFGDGILGRIPNNDTQFTAKYLIGNGRSGNVGADSVYHVISTDDGITGVRNPLPASGGTDPETLEEVRQYAPQAFRVQKRAVTAEDYATVAMLHPEVQKAVATLRWTGSWHTMFISIDRKHGREVDEAFEAELLAFINQYRLAGHDLEIDPPIYVPLDINMTVFVKDGFYKDRVKLALLKTFSNSDLVDGKTGFFHPDNFTFGQPVYLSRVIDAAMQVPGVNWVDLGGESDRFQRWGESAHDELQKGRITLGRLEIARLDNDPNDPENGKIEFEMKGGL